MNNCRDCKSWSKMTRQEGYGNCQSEKWNRHPNYYEYSDKALHENIVGQSEQLINFLIHLNDKGLINNHDFDYEKEAKKYIVINLIKLWT